MATIASHSVGATSFGLLKPRRNSDPTGSFVGALRSTAPGLRPSSACPGCAAQRLTTSSFTSRDLSSRFQVQSLRELKSTARSNQQLGVVRADWNAQVDWKEATITDAKKAGDNPLLTSLWVDVREIEGLTAGYTTPGQYIQMKVGDSKPAYIALASSPKASQSGTLEVLIRDNGGTSELLSKLSKGDKLFVSAVGGKGFNIDMIAPPSDFPTVLIFATGSGISPIRSLIENGFDADKRKDVRLYYGAFRPSAMAFQERFEKWEESGVRVIPVFSEPPGKDGFVGFVQEKYKKDTPIADPAKTGAVLVGQKEMCQELIEMLTAQGIARERILMNF